MGIKFTKAMKYCQYGEHVVLVVRDSGNLDYHSSDTLYDGLCPICREFVEGITTGGSYSYFVIEPQIQKCSLPMYIKLNNHIEYNKEYTEEELVKLLTDLY